MITYGTCRSSQQARLVLLPSLSGSSAVVLRKGGDLARGERRRRKVYSKLTVNEEDPERDRATQV